MSIAMTSLLQMQRRKLSEVTKQLQDTRSQCMKYREIASQDYQGEEATYVIQAINQMSQLLYDINSECYGLDEEFAWQQRLQQKDSR